MDFRLHEHPKEIRKKFQERFVLSWEDFQLHYQDWIAQMAERNYPITFAWYEKDFMWNHMSRDYPTVAFRDALAFLREQEGDVLFLTEDASCPISHHSFFEQQIPNGFVARVNPCELADLVENEWFESYRLAMEDMYNPNPVLPNEVYVFDDSMEWCVVFTHETTDWESELDDPMKAAESRVCIMCRI